MHDYIDTKLTWLNFDKVKPTYNKEYFVITKNAQWITTMEYDVEHEMFSYSSEDMGRGIPVAYWAHIPLALTDLCDAIRYNKGDTL